MPSELQKYIFKSKYSIYNKKAKRRETWEESVSRVRNMMLEKYPQIQDDINWAYDMMLNQRVLGSQRAMQFGGIPALRHNARVYNCCASYVDRLSFFQECFYLLLCGCGTGFSVQKHHIDKLPNLSISRINGKVLPAKTFVVPDTIEGWADSLGILLSSYFEDPIFPEFHETEVLFDYSLIRPKGSPLSSGVGKAPGHKGLEKGLEATRTLLDRITRLEGFHKFLPIHAYDATMHMSHKSVLSGGVRRSATIVIFDKTDEHMLSAKTGNWYYENQQRECSNNSVVLLRNDVSFDEFSNFIGLIKQYGEPGFYFTDSIEQVPNPCFSPDSLLSTSDGLFTVKDLCEKKIKLKVSSDDRVASGDGLDRNNFGVSLHNATPVVLTQKQAKVYKVETEHGHTLKVTETHEFPTLRGRLQLKNMIVGDVILLPSDEGFFGSTGTYNDGFLVGTITGDGTFGDNEAFIDVWEKDFDNLDEIKQIANNSIKNLPSISNGGRVWGDNQWQDQTVATKACKKRLGGRRYYRHLKERLGINDPKSIKLRVPQFILSGSKETIIGYLQGLFFTDGSLNLSEHKSRPTFSLRFHQSNRELLSDVQILLSQFGIVSRLTKRSEAKPHLLPDGKGNMKYYNCKAQFDLILNRSNAINFVDRIGVFGRKREIVNTMIEYCGRECRKPERFISKIKSIDFFGLSDVYCLTQFDTNAVIANGCVTGQCCEVGMWPVDELTGKTGWQMCVSGDTKLIIRDGITRIQDAVGQQIEIWNGNEWSSVIPFKTGENRKLYRVQFSDGSFIDVTDNHRFLVADRVDKKYREVETKDLLGHSKYPLHLPRTNFVYEDGKHVDFAYEYGFIMADGTVRHNHSPFANLFGKKITLPLRGKRGDVKRKPGYLVDSQYITFDEVDNQLINCLKNDDILDEVFSWNYDSIINFISGWIDGDGSQANKGCRLYGTEKRMRTIQLLLTKVGVNSSINMMSKAGEITNYGERNQDIWYLQIADASRLKSFRLNLKNGKSSKYKGKYQVIRSITELPGLHDTYCVTENIKHQCVFNNVLTMQCNLSTINCGRVNNKEEFIESAKAAAILGTCQAGFNEFPYLGVTTENIVKREALLGVSMTGMMRRPKIALDPEIQRLGAQAVIETNSILAEKLHINPCARGTSLKPEGTGTLTLTDSNDIQLDEAGIHGSHAKRYLKLVRANKQEPIFQHFKKYNPWACIPKNDTDEFVVFCIEGDPGTITKKDMSAIEFLENVRSTYKNWIVPGKILERCTQPYLSHNVSNTCEVGIDEWDDVIKYIYNNRWEFSGITLISKSGDKDYHNAPNCEVFTAEENVKRYGDGALFTSGLIEEADKVFETLWHACDAVLKRINCINIEQERWVDRAKTYAKKYFNGDDIKMTYCLKDVYNWKLWIDLKRSYKPVDYEQFIEYEDNVIPTQEVGCMGGSCQII